MHTPNENYPSRRLPGDRFAKLGQRTTSASLLVISAEMCGMSHLEVHFPDGTNIRGQLHDLDVLLEAAAVKDCDYRVIALAAENAGRSHVGIYADLVADEEAPRRNPNYQRRYLTPPEFRTQLLEGMGKFLHPDDYCHRLREITAILAAARPGCVHGQIKMFYKAAKEYRADELKTATWPLASVVYVAKKLPSMQDTETLKFFDLSDPMAHLDNPAPKSISEDALRITAITPPQLSENVTVPRVMPGTRAPGMSLPDQPDVQPKFTPSSPPEPTMAGPTVMPTPTKPVFPTRPAKIGQTMSFKF